MAINNEFDMTEEDNDFENSNNPFNDDDFDDEMDSVKIVLKGKPSADDSKKQVKEKVQETPVEESYGDPYADDDEDDGYHDPYNDDDEDDYYRDNDEDGDGDDEDDGAKKGKKKKAGKDKKKAKVAKEKTKSDKKKDKPDKKEKKSKTEKTAKDEAFIANREKFNYKGKFDLVPEKENIRQLKFYTKRAQRIAKTLITGVLGIVLGALALAINPFFALLGIFVFIPGVITSIIGLVKIRTKGKIVVIIGLALNVIALALCISPIISFFGNMDQIAAAFGDLFNSFN